MTGSQRNPVTDGFICGKVRKIADHLYGADRVLYPMLRTGPKGSGSFRRASWDEALELIVDRICDIAAEHGREAILPYHYGGSNGYLTRQATDLRFFRRIHASHMMRTFCGGPSGSALGGMFQGMPGVALDDYVHARLIVLWGVNPSATGIHLVPYIKEARRRGAKLIVVDPRAIPLAQDADLHLQVRPGADLPVALAVIHWLFENRAADHEFLAQHTTGADILRERAARWPMARAAEIAGVDAADIERFASIYAESNPAVIRCGWGQERNRNGGSSTAAILSIPAVGGKFAVRGGGFSASNGATWNVSRAPAIAEPSYQVRAVNMNLLGRALCEYDDPPIAMLFVYNCNPMSTAPNQRAVKKGFLREDLFTVVYDQVHTDTAQYADVILPATTFLEHHELRIGYGAMYMFDSPAVLEPVGEARPNYQVFAELCRRLGLERPDDPISSEELVAALLDDSPDSAQLKAELLVDRIAPRPQGANPVLFVDTFPGTDDKKIHLVPEHLDGAAPHGLYGYEPDPATETYPLALISPATSRTISSTFAQFIPAPVPVEIHPDDAASRGIRDGDRVRVFNEWGAFETPAKLSRALRPGVICLPKGLWSRHTENGATSNAVIPDSLSDLGGGACFNDARVQIERID